LTANRDTETHQKVLAAWQFFPLYTSSLQFFFTIVIKLFSKPSLSQSSSVLRKTYLALFLGSTGLHVWTTLLDPKSIASMYVPKYKQVDSTPEGAKFFLQWDMICISAAMVGWTVSVLGNRGFAVGRALIGALVGTVFVGPAGVIAGGLWLAEAEGRSEEGGKKRR
jgi:hypothetical protein